MPKGKGFSDFTYGVGLELNATSFKQIKDELKISLDSLSKMVKSYDKVLKIDPNADLSKLFDEVRKIQSVVDGINNSDNSFAGFVDKGMLGRIATLEEGLRSVSSASDEIRANMSGLRESISSALDPLKASGQAKFPATFDDLFGDVSDQSAKIKTVQDQINTLEKYLDKISDIYTELDNVIEGRSSKGKGETDKNKIAAWADQYRILSEKLKQNLNPKDLLNVVQEYGDAAVNLNGAMRTMSDATMKELDLTGLRSSVTKDLQFIVDELDKYSEQLSKKTDDLSSKLAKLEATQAKYKEKTSVRTKSLGIAKNEDGSNYTLRAKIVPDTDEKAWVKKINSTIKNVEPQLTPVKLTPTFSKGKNLKKTIDGNLAQINHTIGVDFKIANWKEFQQKIARIDKSIEHAIAAIKKKTDFKFRFEFEEGKEFKDGAYELINNFRKEFKQFDTTFKIKNGKVFLKEVAGLREKSKQILKDIPASILVDKQDVAMSSVDTLRSQIEQKLSNIDINLTLQNIPQVIAKTTLMKDDLEQLGKVSGTNGVDVGVNNATENIAKLSNKAKKAQQDIEQIKNSLRSLSKDGFKSSEFLKIGDFDQTDKSLDGVREKLSLMVSEYDALSKKLSGASSKEEWFARYPEANGKLKTVQTLIKADADRLKQLEIELNRYVQTQIAYLNQQLEASQQILDSERKITSEQKKRSSTNQKNTSDTEANEKLAMSAEDAKSKIRSLTSTLTHQKKVLQDLDKGFDSSWFVKLGEWDKEAGSFKKNSKYMQDYLKTYETLRKARLASGGKGKPATGEEAKIKGKLISILVAQKKHQAEIIAQTEKERDAVKQLTEAHKQASDNKTKTTKSKTDTDVSALTKQVDQLTEKLNKAKSTLALLKSGGLSVIGSTGLGDHKGVLKASGIKESLNEFLAVYNELIAKKQELEKSGNITKPVAELENSLSVLKQAQSLLNKEGYNALSKTSLGDINGRLKNSSQTIEGLVAQYKKLRQAKLEFEEKGDTTSNSYAETVKSFNTVKDQLTAIYQDQQKEISTRIQGLQQEIAKKNEYLGVTKRCQEIEEILSNVYKNQLEYTQSQIKVYNDKIAKAKELLQIESQQTKNAETKGKVTTKGKTKKTEEQQSVKASPTETKKTHESSMSATVKLDGATLNSLAKDATLRAINGKISNVLSKLGDGIKITGSNIAIQADNVSVSGKTSSSNNNTKGAGKNPDDKKVALSTISSFSQQLIAFEERAKRAGTYTDELKQKFADLYSQLNAIKIQEDVNSYKFDLDRFKEDFEQLKTYDKLYQDFIKSQAKQIVLNDQIATSKGSTAELQAQLKAEEEKSIAIETQLKNYTTLYNQRVRQLAIDEAIKKANDEIAQNIAKQNDKDVNKQNSNVSKIVDSAQKKLDDMQYVTQNSKLPMSDAAIAKVKEYEQLLTSLKAKQQEIYNNPQLLQNADYKNGFDLLLRQMDEAESKFGILRNSSEKFLSKIRSVDDIKPLGSTFDAANLTQLHTAMQEFADQAGVGAAKLIEFNDVERTATFEIKNGKGQVQQLTVAYDEATNSLGRYASKTKESLTESQKFFNSLKHSFQNVARYIASFGSVYRLFAMIKQGVTYVKEIDSALTELKKVTDETDASYNQFLQDMSKTAGVVGSTVSELTTMAADWARLGYSMEEAGKLAESTAVLLNVSEFADATRASEALISTMQAFQYTADESQHVVDILNEVGNNFAVSSDGIATALQDSASALMAGGNSLEQAVALVASANRVVQDPNSVGSALRTISLRLRGTSVKILEEMGEETEGVIESTSKLQEKIKALSGVDILTNTGGYKDTYTILRQIGTVWESMSDIDQAALLELMAGKNRANTLSAILSNMKDLEGAYQSALNAEGSALRENETYLDSIQGRLDLLANEVQSFWMNTIESDTAKWVIDLGTGIMELVNKIGLIPTALAGVLFYFTAIKKNNPATMFKELSTSMHNYGQALNQIKAIQSLNGANGSAKMDTTAFNDQHIKAYGMAVEGLTQKQQVAALATAGLTKEQIAQAIGVKDLTDANFQEALAEAQVTTAKKKHITVSGALLLANKKDVSVKLSQKAQNFLLKHSEEEITDALIKQGRAKDGLSKRDVRDIKTKRALTQENMKQAASWKGLTSSIGQLIKQNPVMFFTMLSTAITALVSKIETATDRTEKLTEAYNELQSSISELEGNINSLDSELSTIQDKIDELNNKDSLSLADAEQLNLLKQQSAELERQKELQEHLLKARENQNQVKSLSMINNLIETTNANQKKSIETWKNIGSVAGSVASIIAGIALFFADGPIPAGDAAGATMIAKSVGTITKAAKALSTGSKLIGTTLMASVGGQLGGTAGTLIADKVNASESFIEWYEKYEKAISDAQQKADEAESKYMSKMTENNHKKWQEKLEYVNTLRTEMYDGLEEMQGYISDLEYTDETAGIIDGYNELMVYLDAKSYEGDIGAQISSIESLKSEYYELSRGVDENGKNIALSTAEYARYKSIISQIAAYTPQLIQGYDAEGNAILNRNTLLADSIELLKEQQRLAAYAITYGEDGQDDKRIVDVYNGIIEQNKEKFKNVEANEADYIKGWNNYNVSEKNSIAAAIQNIIGEAQGFWELRDQYIARNASAISENYDAIISALGDTFKGEDLEGVKSYLNEIISQVGTFDTIATQFKSTLYSIPQASKGYYDLSGDSLDFINNYINSYVDGIENIDKLKEHDLVMIRDNIASLTDELGNNKEAQELIGGMFDIDANKIPVGAYKQKIMDVYTKLLSPDIAPELTNELEAMGIINQETWFAMVVPTNETIDAMQEAVKAKLKPGVQGLADNLSLEELKVAFKIIPDLPDDVGFTELKQAIEESLPKATGPIVETYSALAEQITKFNEIITQTSEIVLDNTKVTQEYKDSLVELGISEEDLADCFDSTNSLVVANAKNLNNLVKSSKKNTTQNIQLAKSQARLQYYELYKKMDLLVGANGEVADGNIDIVRSLYAEMNALEKTIARYSMLEAQLLGAANAYEEFQKAQEIDSQTDYISSAEDMILALGQAFNTAELGSESAQVAIKGLVPKSVYEDLDTVDEKMAAIYEYFKKGKISQYFDLEFNEDGGIESAEMKLGNLRKFIEDGLTGDVNGDGINVFEGADWQHFELSEGFIQSIKDADDPLQEFADQMDVTKEVAFAFVKSFKDHDIEWLDGDYYTFFDQMLAGTNEGAIQLYTERLSDLTVQQAELAAEKKNLIQQYDEGSISEEEYNKRIQEIDKKQVELNKSLDDYNKKLAEAQNVSKQNIFGTGAEGTQYEGQADYQIKTSAEIEATDNLDELDNWIERNEKVKQLQEEQSKAQEKYQNALEEYEASEKTDEDLAKLNEAQQTWKDTTTAVSEAIEKRDEFTKPTVLEIEVAIDDIEGKIESTKKTLDEKLAEGEHLVTVEIDGQTITKSVTSTEELLNACFHQDEDGYWTINAGVDKSELEQKYPEILSYVNFLNSDTTLTSYLNADDTEITLETVTGQIDKIIELLDDMKINLDPDSVREFSAQLGELCKPRNIIANIGAFVGGVFGSGDSEVNGTAHARGTVHKGKAYKSGDWGLPTNEEDSLIGELGPEMVVDPSTGRYYTVGDAGAEMVDLPKGAIIFNHEQTKGLLQHGHIASRGKAYAEGNAHVTIFPNGSSKDQWDGTGYSSWDDPTYDAAEALSNTASDLSDAASDLSDAADEFNETFDWIEVRLEELDETLSLLSARLENATGYSDKNSIIDEIIGVNNTKITNLNAAIKEYSNYAAKLLNEVPAQYREAAQNGAIAIDKFTGEADEKTLEAIQNYREWAQKVADTTQQVEELKSEITDLAKQKFDNVSQDFENFIETIDSYKEQYEAMISYVEETGNIAPSEYYESMMEKTQKNLKAYQMERNALQSVLDSEVKAGRIKVNDDAWYEMVNTITDVDLAIKDCILDMEKYQNAINDIYWDNFDELINRLGYLKDETQSLIDLMDNEDMVITPETEDGWSADQVEWTKEGMASLGLYAQQMEIAEYEAKQYAEAIEDLTADYKKGLYSESEYLEKLNELKEGQYDSIEAYHDAQDAIVECNKARVDAIKEGIEKEIEAYEKLIEKKKEELDSEKDLYDFQKKVSESSKNIADIQRKIAALSGDNSASAIAQRKKLEAELAEAKADQEEMYYERSIENQQNALDRELENFQEEKDAEVERWEEYLTNIEQVVADSLNVVQANATEIGNTLTTKAEEYNLTVSDAVLSPWKDGAIAVSDYQTAFGASMSSTMEQLEALKTKWQEVIDKMAEAAKVEIAAQEQANSKVTAAKEEKPKTSSNSTNTASTTNKTQQKAITVGGKINAGSAKIYSYAGDTKGAKQYFSSDPIYVVLSEQNGYLKVRHHKLSSGATGWFKKSDVKAYAKGTTGVDEDQWALLDELGEELVLNAGPDGRLQYLSKGSSVLTHDLTERLMDLAMNPQEVLDRSRPTIAPSKSVVNNNMEIHIDASVGELIHVDRLEGNNLDEINKFVDKAWDKKMQGLNNSLKKFVR